MDTVRVAMWSGPRNISTAMMRSFGARPDTAVVDEPFYAAYLAMTGLEHPMRAEVLASQPNDWRDVIPELLGSAPQGSEIWYQKHMTHHMLPEIDRTWLPHCRNAFLIRDPVAVLASYAAKRSDITLADIGVVQQRELFEQECNRLGSAPPVIDSADILADPAGMLAKLCNALHIPYMDAMLSWPPGRRDTDGVWASAWYAAVERSTGFERPSSAQRPALKGKLLELEAAARPHYESLSRYALARSA